MYIDKACKKNYHPVTYAGYGTCEPSTRNDYVSSIFGILNMGEPICCQFRHLRLFQNVPTSDIKREEKICHVIGNLRVFVGRKSTIFEYLHVLDILFFTAHRTTEI